MHHQFETEANYLVNKYLLVNVVPFLRKFKKMDNWPDNDTWNRWKNDPSKWIWGLFYYNKEDPRLLVPKKIEWMGVTVNFADRRFGPVCLGFFAFWATMVGLVIYFEK